MTIRKTAAVIALLVACAIAASAQPARRPLKVDDLARMREISDPQISPDGKWVAYVVSTVDLKEDKAATDIWTVAFDTGTERQMTASSENESSPRWSPDGRYLSFTSSRPGPAKGNQVWILDRQGGEATQLTDVKGRLQGYEWSPDAKRLALVVGDPDPDADIKVPKPIVVDRYKFKQDGQGYLLSGRHSYIYLFDVATKKLDRLTSGKFDEAAPSWSPDGSRLAFLANRAPDPDRDPSNQIFVAEARPGATERPVTPAIVRGRSRLDWSPDGKSIAFLESDDKKFGAYNMDHLAVVAADGGSAPQRIKAVEALDRGVSAPRFAGDSSTLTFVVTDDRSAYLARVKVTGGSVERLLAPPIVVTGVTMAAGRTVALSGGDSKASEVHAIEGHSVRPLTRQNDALFSELQVGTTEEVGFPSKDGTDVHGLLVKPVGYVAGSRVPLLLRIHGGPNSQDQHTFSFERQFFAGKGYAVLAVNYRGSAGRGQKFSRAIHADWGHYEVDDLQAGVDHVIKLGVADPNRLGVGGWSYGGILTDYLIASDQRFKAATSGAGTAFTVAFYGTDQYIIQYDHEIGPPWNAQAWQTYQKISYPFLHADRIKTPTLFLGGERDFNVPIQGSQQMYQALRSLGVDTELVIYPNENHGITRPSYVRDRLERYLAWYDRYLKKAPATTSASSRSRD